ncbi:MAG: hypothetical protein HOO06_08245 [Bdellovibrionaceae bacterium]|nr:hypothetical protein [Pseudobdellovibrionaceae bacterium]
MNILSKLGLLAVLVISLNIQAKGKTTSKSGFFQGWEVQLGMDAPLYTGVRGKAYFPKNFYASAALGLAPSFLVELQSSLGKAVGTINDLDAVMFDNMLSGSMYFDLRGGWNMDGKNSFFVEVGYSQMSGGGSDTSQAAIEDVLDRTLSSSLFTGQSVKAEASLGLLSIHAGYNWPMTDQWVLSASGGLLKPISSSQSIQFSTRTSQRDDIENEVNNIMDSSFGSMFLLTASVWAGYRF